jgi:hypothetical protein
MSETRRPQVNARVPGPWLDAWGRICDRLGVTRTSEILDLVRATIEEHGDAADLADLAAGQAEAERLRARNRIGRPPAPRAVGSDPYIEVLERAMGYAREHFPQAAPQRRAAFANSVAYLVFHMAGGYGGPSVREHAAARKYAAEPRTYEEAVSLLADPGGVIFGPLTSLHHQCWLAEHCFDDDPQDARALRAELGQDAQD